MNAPGVLLCDAAVYAAGGSRLELGNGNLQIPYSILITVGKAAWINLINHSAFPPFTTTHSVSVLPMI